MELAQLGREGLLDDTKPLLREKAIYNKLENNEKAMQEDSKGFYDMVAKDTGRTA